MATDLELTTESLDTTAAADAVVEEMSDFERQLHAEFEVQDHPPEFDAPATGDADELPSDLPSAAGSEGTPDEEPESEPVTYQLGDRTLTASEAEAVLGLMEWSNALSQDDANRIQDLLSGQYELAPRTPTATPSTPAPVPTVGSVLDGVEFDEFTDPRLIAAFKSLETQQSEKYAALEAKYAAVEASTNQVQMSELERSVTQARDIIMERHGLDAGQFDYLSQQTVNSGIVGHLSTTSQLEGVALFDAAFEQTLWNDPKLRSEMIDRQIEAKVSSSQQELSAIQATNRDKKTRAAAVSSNGGSVPRTAPSPRDMTPQQREHAMAEEIAAAMGG